MTARRWKSPCAKTDVRAEGLKALQWMEENHRKGIVLAGRPYHVDPEINHGMPELIASYGLAVLTEDSIPVSFHGTLRRGTYTGSCDIPGVLSCAQLRAQFHGGTADSLFVVDGSGFWLAAPLHSISAASDRSCAVIRLWTAHTVTDNHISGRWDADDFSYIAIGDIDAARALAIMQ